MLVIVFVGLPGSGKSTLAKLTKNSIQGSVLISSDFLRQKLFLHFTEEDKKLIYSDTFKQVIYNAIFATLDIVKNTKETVILDATFTKRENQELLETKINSWKSKLLYVVCEAPESIISQRLNKRSNTSNLSDADFSVYLKLKQNYNIERFGTNSILINTSNPIGECLKSVMSEINDSYISK